MPQTSLDVLLIDVKCTLSGSCVDCIDQFHGISATAREEKKDKSMLNDVLDTSINTHALLDVFL